MLFSLRFLTPGRYRICAEQKTVSRLPRTGCIPADFWKHTTALFGKAHPKPQKLFFHLRGKLRCGHCGCALTASRKKGYDYYYCTNGRGFCRAHQNYLRSEILDGVVATALDEIKFDPQLIELAYLAAKEKTNLNENYRQSSLDNITKQLDFITKRRSKLLDSCLDEIITKEVYEAKMN